MRRVLLGSLKKKGILAVVVGALVFSSAYAFAATLGVTSNSLGAGNASVTSCAASVTAAYTTTYDSTIPGYRVSGVNLNNLTACSGKAITVDLTGAGNASLSQVTYTVLAADATAGNKTITVPGSINAGLVTGVSVVIAG
jgi:hypothetical protein